MTSPVFEYPILIREFHLDTFGHVNNAAYLTIFEEARWDLITRNGFGVKEIQQTKMGPIILEVQLKFLKELRLREQVVIQTQLMGYKGVIGQLSQKMINGNGDVACEAKFVMGLFDMTQRKLISPTPQWITAIGGMTP